MAEPEYLTVDHLTTKQITRIFSRVEVDPLTGCWNLRQKTLNDGYARIYYKNKPEKAHRVMYAWLIGPIPKGCRRDIPQLDHIICNNRQCCFPAHLKLRLPKENILRGNAPPAVNARKTHCIRGHLLPTESNCKRGGRRCNPCRKIEFQRAWHGPNKQKVRQRHRDNLRAWRARQRSRLHEEP